ncbi:MFS transporter [uncultured Litoreibacter sp.]|uniref:MFS transporter n=1 Tax=uncultured Litoreibacter sp. TaxID=1392394 RepID=UPI002606838E|nr:MFS transporter [uncultured Litoreibacter sp.]
MSAVIQAQAARLPAWSLFGAVLSGAGLPIYIYAPKFYADNFGINLTLLGAVLFGLRLFDVVQDPVLGWVSERLGKLRRLAVWFAGLVLAASMYGLFAIEPPIGAVWWFGLTITGLFTAFSFMSINFYAEGVTKASSMNDGHTRLAAWRETGALLGVCLAAVAPSVLEPVVDAPFAIFAVSFGLFVLAALIWMTPEWTGGGTQDPTPIRAILNDTVAKRLLILALVNATPVAVSSTLFLFYVESRLDAPGWEGPLLVLFFFAAAASSPFWARLSDRVGPKRALLSAMVLAILFYACVLALGAGDVWLFAIICVLSGATIGADLTLLPAMFARRMAQVSPNGGQGFGLWSLVSKFTLAFAAAVLLPILQLAGFTSGATNNPETALSTLTYLYALVPCILKLVAIGLLAATPLED